MRSLRKVRYSIFNIQYSIFILHCSLFSIHSLLFTAWQDFTFFCLDTKESNKEKIKALYKLHTSVSITKGAQNKACYFGSVAWKWLKLVFCVTFLIAYKVPGLIATETAAVLFSWGRSAPKFAFGLLEFCSPGTTFLVVSQSSVRYSLFDIQYSIFKNSKFKIQDSKFKIRYSKFKIQYSFFTIQNSIFIFHYSLSPISVKN